MDPRVWRRCVAEYTLQELADRVDVGCAHVSMVERGLRAPSCQVVAAYERLSEGLVTAVDFDILLNKDTEK